MSYEDVQIGGTPASVLTDPLGAEELWSLTGSCQRQAGLRVTRQV